MFSSFEIVFVANSSVVVGAGALIQK